MEGVNRATIVKMESKSDLPTSNKFKDSNMTNDASIKKEGKKRGVYVEKRMDPEPLLTEEEDGAIESAHPSETENLPETTSAPSKKQTPSRNLNISDPMRTSQNCKSFEKIESKMNKLTEKVTTTSKILPPVTPTKPTKPQRNIIEENIQQIKTMKFRSSILKESKLNAIKESKKIVVLKRNTPTPSVTPDVTKVLSISDQLHWSNIFPRDSKTSTCTNRLKEYIHSYKIDHEHDAKTLNENIYDPVDGKDKNIYNFLIDLLDTVYDENLKSPDNPTTDNIDITVIEDEVARKLYVQEPNEYIPRKSYQRKLQDYNPFQHKLPIVDCYNQMTIIPQKVREYPKKNKLNKPKVQIQARVQHKTSRKQNLLALLKRQLSSNYYSYEPESMYEALQNIAKNKRVYKRNLDYSLDEKTTGKTCKFRGRRVTTPIKKLPKNNDYPKYNTPLSLSNGNFVSQLLGDGEESNDMLRIFQGDYDS